jgi:hypothetical protein
MPPPPPPLLSSLVGLVAAQPPVVTTTTGAISGETQDGVDGFLGIPFAQSQRFGLPTARQAWSGVRVATTAGKHCVEGAGPAAPHSPCPAGWCAAHNAKPDECGCGVCGSFGGCSFSCTPGSGRVKCPASPPPAPAPPSDPEDCLFLNAFTPSLAGREAAGTPLAPVMVHIHGGGFVGGAATTAWNLTRDTGSVVFSIQYRLGVLGFFGGGGGAGGGGFGMADQQFALRWVQDNAAAFGGDSKRVMIFGCSAVSAMMPTCTCCCDPSCLAPWPHGAHRVLTHTALVVAAAGTCTQGGASVAGHLVLPQSKGLYHAAGIESPGGHQGWEAGTVRGDDDWMSVRQNLAFSDTLAKQLGCAGRTDLDCLRKSDLKTLYTASKKLHFAPAMDKAGSFPLGEISLGKWNKVPTIVGGQSCESCHTAVGAFGYPNPNRPVTKEAFDEALVKAGFSGWELAPDGTNKSAIGPELLEVWYADRIKTEGRWRTFARINSDS